MIVGHRGAAGYAPENTLLSFQKAIELGCRAVEMDVHLSKDGEAVIIHDAKVDRVTDGKGKVRKMTLAQLRQLVLPLNQHIPTLQEAIDLCRGRTKMFIELKAKGTPERVAQLAAANKIENEVVILSFKVGLLKRIKKLDPRLRVGLLFYRKPLRLWGLIRKVGINYLGPRLSAAKAKLINKAHKLHRRVYVYGVKDPSSQAKMKRWKVDAVCTDFPILFVKQKGRKRDGR